MSRRKLTVLWLAAGVLGLAVAAGLTLPYWLSPILHRNVVDFLSSKYESDVRIERFTVAFVPAPRVTIEGLRLQRRNQPGAPPLITIRRAVAHAGWFGVLLPPRRASLVELEGLVITIDRRQPRNEPKPESAGGPKGFRRSTPVVIDEIAADGTLLRIIPKDPDKDPMDYDLYRLRLFRAGADRPMTFRSQLRNATPPGLIQTTGQFGPWYSGDPGKTPVSGTYQFRNANLGAFNGLGGILSSDGRYGGVLERLSVSGWTDVPDFQVKVAGNPLHLRTEFEATVDGTSGDTALHPVTAHWGESTLVADGFIHGRPGVPGKTVSLKTVMNQARVEDVLMMGVKCDPAPLTGRINFQADLEIPPGDTDVMHKIGMKAKFRISRARFASGPLQERLDRFSQRAKGEPKTPAPEAVRPGMDGDFQASAGRVTFRNLVFEIPGAELQLAGRYDLSAETLDFAGKVRLEAKLSQTTTGVKSLLLKAVDPFFHRNGAGAEIPLRITGTRAKPHVGLKLR